MPSTGAYRAKHTWTRCQWLSGLAGVSSAGNPGQGVTGSGCAMSPLQATSLPRAPEPPSMQPTGQDAGKYIKAWGKRIHQIDAAAVNAQLQEGPRGTPLSSAEKSSFDKA